MKITSNKFNEIYNIYKPRLLGFARKIIYSDQKSEEIVHDVFIKLLEQDWEKIEDHIHQWLFLVCKNRSLSILHREKRYEFFGEKEESDSDLSEDPNPQEKLIIKEDFKKVLHLLEKLSPLQKKVIELRYLKGLDNVEIAKKLKMKNTNAAYHVSDGCKKLREMLAKSN